MNYKDYVACEDQLDILHDAAMHFNLGINELEISLEAGNKALADDCKRAADILKCIEDERARLRGAMGRYAAPERMRYE